MKATAAVVLGIGLVLLGSSVSAQKGKGAKEVVVQGKTISEWIKALQGKDVDDRYGALNALMRAGSEARRAAPALVATFGEKDGVLTLLAGVVLKRIGGDAVPALQKALDDDKPTVRAMAASTLGLLGDAARPAIPALTKALKDREASVRSASAAALGRLGSPARPALPALVAVLDDSDLSVSVEAATAFWRVARETRGVAVLAKAAGGGDRALAEQAVHALGEIGPKAKDATAALRAALDSKEASLRIAAATALYRVAGDVKATLPVLEAATRPTKDGDPRTAVSALGALGAEEAAVAALVRLMKDKDADLRREAASALSERGAKVDSSRKALEAGLSDPDLGVRWWCALVLAATEGDVRKHEEDILRAFRQTTSTRDDREPEGKEALQVVEPLRAVPALSQVLKARPPRLQLEAARVLGKGWLETRSAREDLVEALRSDDKLVRRAVAEALAALGVEALPELLKLTSTADARQREGAARALGQMGVQARSALPAITRLLNDSEAAVRTQAALALWNIDQNAELALQALNLVLKDVDQQDRWEAVEAVGIIGTEARPAIKGLTEVLVVALKDRDARVRVQAARSLWRRTREAKTIVPLLRDVVGDRDLLARWIAVETLGEMGADERASALLIQALDDRDVSVRLLATEGLSKGGNAAVPVLVDALGSKSPRVRVGVTRALGVRAGVEAKATAALEKLAKDTDPAVRAAAEEALRGGKK